MGGRGTKACLRNGFKDRSSGDPGDKATGSSARKNLYGE